jgi:ADP-heptose:LPS heptosyltransferase
VLVDREGLGDVILKAPFLRGLRRAFPEHEVWWIATQQSSMAHECRPLFERDVAKVITHSGLDGPVGPLVRRLKALPPFERVFDSRTKISTVALSRLLLTHRGFYCCLPGFILCDGRPPPGRRRPRRIAERMMAMIACATDGRADMSGRLEASAAANEQAARLLPAGPTYVGIAPGSRQADKNWPLEHYCEVARALSTNGLTPVFLLGPREGDVEAQIRAAAPGALVLRADPAAAQSATLDLLIAEGQRLAVLVANDNGVGHLLGAAGAPVVSLFGPTDPARWAPLTPAAAILRARDFGGGGAIEAIPPGAVIEAVMAMLPTRLSP